jgi:hypothetical protein
LAKDARKGASLTAQVWGSAALGFSLASLRPASPLQACSSASQLIPLHTLLRGPRAATLLSSSAASPMAQRGGPAAPSQPSCSHCDPVQSGVLAWMPLDFELLPMASDSISKLIQARISWGHSMAAL